MDFCTKTFVKRHNGKDYYKVTALFDAENLAKIQRAMPDLELHEARKNHIVGHIIDEDNNIIGTKEEDIEGAPAPAPEPAPVTPAPDPEAARAERVALMIYEMQGLKAQADETYGAFLIAAMEKMLMAAVKLEPEVFGNLFDDMDDWKTAINGFRTKYSSKYAEIMSSQEATDDEKETATALNSSVALPGFPDPAIPEHGTIWNGVMAEVTKETANLRGRVYGVTNRAKGALDELVVRIAKERNHSVGSQYDFTCRLLDRYGGVNPTEKLWQDRRPYWKGHQVSYTEYKRLFEELESDLPAIIRDLNNL